MNLPRQVLQVFQFDNDQPRFAVAAMQHERHFISGGIAAGLFDRGVERQLLGAFDFDVQAIESDDHVFALQGHPEFKKGYSEDLINWRREILGEEVYQAGLDSLSNDLQSPELALWMIRFLKGNASV